MEGRVSQGPVIDPSLGSEARQLTAWTARVGPRAAALVVAQKAALQRTRMIFFIGGGLFLIFAFAHTPRLCYAIGVPLMAISIVPWSMSWVYLRRQRLVVDEVLGLEHASVPALPSRYLKWCEVNGLAPYPFMNARVPTHAEARSLRKKQPHAASRGTIPERRRAINRTIKDL